MRTRIWSATIGALASTVTAIGAEPVKLTDLIREALANNPEIRAAQKRYEAARQRPAQESSLPDPMVSVGYASNGGPLPGQGLGSQPTSNIGVMVSQELPYPGKRRLRGGVAAKEAGVSQHAQPDKALRPVTFNIGVAPSTVRRTSGGLQASQHSPIMVPKKCTRACKSVPGR